MDNVFHTGLSFWQFIVAILTVTLSIVTIRIGIRFDLNKYLEERDKKIKQRLMNACVHMELIPTKDGKIEVRSFFISPPGTLQWQCQRCGQIRYQADGDWEKEVSYYLKNLDEYKKQNEKFIKLLKTSKLI